MSFVTQLSIGWFPIIIVLIIYFDNHRVQRFSSADQIFDWLLLSTIALSVSSIFSWFPEGYTSPNSRSALWLLNIIYLSFSCLVLYLWMLYNSVQLQANQSILKRPLLLSLLSVPAAAVILLAVTAPLTRLLFFIDRGNHYQRGILYLVPYIVDLFYIIAASGIALNQFFKANTEEQRRNSLVLATFAPLPILGIILQSLIEGLWLAIPFSVLSILIVYIVIQNQRITIDALTGLNNRREFFRYTNEQMKMGASICLIIADINHFREVNSTYGRTVGDEALRRCADVFRETFPQTKTFLARYGGDEFALIAPCDDDTQAKHIVDRINNAFEQSSTRGSYPYELSVSIGYALYDKRYSGDIDSLIDKADRQLRRSRSIQGIGSNTTGQGGAK
ncbi:MAG: diguanylate cyclase [Ruminococcaceae bacterium]|nr:diguanylate cyclase [Oscillospiraceae bacterium]